MPRRLLGVFMLLLVSVSLMWAQGEAVLFTVGADTVRRAEFEYYFAKSPEKRADVFAGTYAHFKQKVLYARELGLDTLPDYLKRKEAYRTVWQQTNRSKAVADTCSRQEEWVKLIHATFPLRQTAGKQEQRQASRYMDSLHTALKGKAGTGMEELPWVQTRYLLNEWRSRLERLPQGECSLPFWTPLGMHIIAWKEKSQGYPSARAEERAGAGARWLKEMEEGLLLVALEAYWTERLACTERELEDYFKRHRADYGGGVPHFQGAVVHCRDEKHAKAIRKYLKQYPETLWKEAIGRMEGTIREKYLVEVGLFAIGTNAYVDKLVFKCGDFEVLADYPYTWVLGKKLKKGPTDYKWFRREVENACREAQKKAEMEAVGQKYRVEIDEEVLKTVNRAGNK